jgi:hypothetical protein
MKSINTIRNPWLTIFRVVWLLTAPLNLVLSIANLPETYHQLNNLVPPNNNVGWTHLTFSSAVAAAGITPVSAAWLILLPNLINILAFSLVGLLIFWRKSDEWIGLLVSYALIGIAGTFTDSGLLSLVSIPQPWSTIIYIIGSMVWFFFFLFLCLFPNGRYEPRWTRWVAGLFTVFFLVVLIFNQAGDNLVSFQIVAYIIVFLFLVGQIHRYIKISTLTERQQTRWFLFAFCVFLVVGIATSYFEQSYLLPAAPTAAKLWFYLFEQLGTNLVFTLFPAAIAIALFRYKLWNIDLIIRRALVYGALTASLGLVYFGGVVLLEQIFHALTGQASPLAVVISTLIIAGLFTPLRRGLQSAIDRRFFRQRYNASLALDAFSNAVRSEVEVNNLTQQLAAVVKNTIQPEQVSIWLQPLLRGIPIIKGDE